MQRIIVDYTEDCVQMVSSAKTFEVVLECRSIQSVNPKKW